jgi:restriction endonuclease S subunit
MIIVKKSFTLKKSELSKKFRVENNNLDISALVQGSGYDAVRLGDIASAHRNERNRRDTAESVIKYVQISDIDVFLGRIKSFRKFKGSEAPNNARRIMKCGDILVSTRRPTRGAVVTVPSEFHNEICTVFFTTLTVLDWEKYNPFYISLFLRTSLGRLQFQSMITETAYPVISDEDVENIIVLVPPLETQFQIVENYNSAAIGFFEKLNSAYDSIVTSKQQIENIILIDAAETIEPIRFGLEINEIISEVEENEDENGD